MRHGSQCSAVCCKLHSLWLTLMSGLQHLAGGLKRIEEKYTWARYANRLLSLSRMYSFWKYVSKLERRESRRYLEMFYALKLRPLIAKVSATAQMY